MTKVDVEYLSGQINSVDYGNDVAAAIAGVREIFRSSTQANIAGGFVTLDHDGKRVTFPTDGGVSFDDWEANRGGPWGSRDEFLRRIQGK